MFNSLNSAIEREEADARESRINFASSVAGLIQLLDQELQTVNKPEFFNWIFTDLMKVDEEKFKAMINANKANTEGNDDYDDPLMDSALGEGDEKIKQLIYKCIAEVFENE